MALNEYLRLFKKWGWFIGLAAALAAGASYVIALDRPILYEAQTTLSIGNFIQSINPNSDAITTGKELAPTYAYLLTTSGVLQPTIAALDLPLTPDELRGMIETSIQPDTSLLTISVVGDDPASVVAIANEVAHQLVQHSPTNLTQAQQRQIELADLQIERLNNQIETLYQKLEEVDRQLASGATGQQAEDLSDDRLALVDQINYATSVISNFSVSISYIQQRTNSLEIVEAAQEPMTAAQAGSQTTILLGALVGSAAAGAIVLLYEYLDDRIRTTDDAVQIMGVPVLGSVARFDRAAVKAGRNLIINCHPTEPIAEMYHAIRTNMLALNGPNPTFLIASPEQGDGKSMTTANLAISMAMANLRVLLIDADLRRPSLHEIFGLENRTGLSTLLLQARNDQFDIQEETAARLVLQQCLQATGIPNLSIITSGPAPAQSPSTMLGSSLMQAWLAVFQQASSVDVVLIDTPPSLVVPDSIALAAAIHAVSVLVVDSGRTRREAALRAKQQFDQVGKPLAGVIVNRVRRMDDEYYSYGYEYGKLPAKRGGPFKRLIG